MFEGTIRTSRDPAAQASSLLLRLGLALLFIVTPVASVPSRRAFLVLAPVSIALVLAAALLEGRLLKVATRAVRQLRGPVGVAACFLLIWAVVSLSWTPNPAAGLDRLVKTAGTALLTLGACASLPDRMRSSNLYLVALGVLAGMAMTAAAVAYGLVPRRAFDPEQPTLDRAMAGLSIGLFAAAGWLVTKGRLLLAFCLALLFIGVAAAAQAIDALTALVVGLIVLGAARTNLRASALAVATVTAGLVIFAPGVGVALGAFATRLTWLDASDVAGLQRWAATIMADPARLITGHGVETAARARFSSAFGAPRSVLFEVWYEFGLLGAAALAVIIAGATMTTVRLGAGYGAFVQAALAVIFVHLVIGSGTGQTWWTTTLCVYAVAFYAVRNGQYRSVRPRAVFRARAAAA